MITVTPTFHREESVIQDPSTPPYGFLLVTSDPELATGGRGSAYQLVTERLQKGLWPLYAGTRNRKRITEGSRLGFYVAGTKENSCSIVATARVKTTRSCLRRERVDDLSYLIDHPSIVLFLEGISMLQKPIQFRDRLPHMSIRPTNPHKWGTLLMGGSRAMSDSDWAILFGTATKK